MEGMRIDDIVRATGGCLKGGNGQRPVSGVAINSREVRPGDLFFAFSGSRTDGHHFVGDAHQRGAAGAVVTRPVEVPAGFPLIQVSDSLQALQALAASYRQRFAAVVVGVTGSTGKTGTKDLIAGVLSSRFPVLKTRGNHNNEIGLPLTLLELGQEHRAVVLEMAMRGPGEISSLCRIARPVMGVITNIGKTHLELLGSQEAIAKAKGELIEALPDDGWAILNGDDPWQLEIGRRATCRVLYYGTSEACQIRCRELVLRGLQGSNFILETPSGGAGCHLPFPGRHNVLNSLAAAAVGECLGLSPEEITRGLAAAEMTGMRLEVKRGWRGCLIIDDTYNASPDSVKAALELLVQEHPPGRTVALLGDMYELGSESLSGHREVGRTAADLGVDLLLTIGGLAREIAAGAGGGGLPPERVRHFENKGAVVDFLKGYLTEGDLLLVKGSRGMKMEEITSALTQEGEQPC